MDEKAIPLPGDVSKYLTSEEEGEMKQVFTKKLIPKSIKDRIRILDNWYDQYLKYAADSASPPIFHKWVALSTLASALERKVFWDFEFELTYANMFVFLIGDSGTKKTTALNVAKPLVVASEINRMPTRLTPEDFYHRMKSQAAIYCNEDDLDEVLCKQTATSVFASELSVFFAGDIDSFVQSLTDIFDCRIDGDPWHYSTLHNSEASMDNNWLNMLACTTPKYILKSLPSHARDEGFLGRVIMVYAKPVRIKSGLPIGMALKAGLLDTEGEYKGLSEKSWKAYRANMKDKLTEDLKQVKLLCGEMNATREALIAFNQWFNLSEEAIYNDKLLVKRDTFGGYLTRRSVFLRKLMILFSVARGNSLVITIEDFNRARDLINETEKYMSNVFIGAISDVDIREATLDILKYMWNLSESGKLISKMNLLNHFMLKIDIDMIEKVVDQLSKLEHIKIQNMDTSTGDILYVLTDKGRFKTASVFGPGTSY
jgi:hypothetical protein